MSPVSPTTIRPAVNALFVILLVTPFFLAWWLARDSDDTIAGQYGFYLTDATAAAGIDFVHAKPALDPALDPIMSHLTALGASVSVMDYDNDGWQDLYVTTSQKGFPNALYRNLSNGSFEEVAEQVGLAQANDNGGVSMGSVWGDYDNDGFEDVFIYKWGRQRLYRNQGDGVFADATGESGLGRWMNANSAVWTDVDRDGLIDLYVGGYFSEVHDLWRVTTTRIMQESFEYANNGGHNYLFLNRGDGRFEDVTEEYGADCTRWTMSVGGRGPERRRLARSVSGQRLRSRGPFHQPRRKEVRATRRRHAGGDVQKRHERGLRRPLQRRPSGRLRDQHFEARLSFPGEQSPPQPDRRKRPDAKHRRRRNRRRGVGLGAPSSAT